MIKKYMVYPDPANVLAPQIPAGILIDVSTPIDPVNPLSQLGGVWVDEDPALTQPIGLGSDLYKDYNHLVVNGCSVSVRLSDNPDAATLVTPVAGNDITTGVISMVRSPTNNTYSYGTQFASDTTIRQAYGSKQSRFTLASTNTRAKGARLQLGYSSKRQFGPRSNGTGRFWVLNTPTAGYTTCSDPTFMNIFIGCNDVIQNHNLAPFKVSIMLRYSVTFIEPTSTQSIPLPMPRANRYERRIKKPSGASYPNTAMLAKALAAALPLMATAGRQRQAALRYR